MTRDGLEAAEFTKTDSNVVCALRDVQPGNTLEPHAPRLEGVDHHARHRAGANKATP